MSTGAMAQTQSENLLDDWSIQFDNTARWETYHASGDKTQSPYYQEGGQFYDEMGLAAQRRISSYETLQVNLGGVFNRSAYRSQHRNFTLERGNAIWEKGGEKLSIKATGGDVYAYQSERTIQTSLRGGLVDFQPVVEGDVRHSIQVFSGVIAGDYRTLDMWDTGFSGISWLMENEGETGGSLVFNWGHGHVDGNPSFFSPGIDQQVMSVAGELPFMWGTHSMTVEAEYAYLDGDISGAQRIDDSGHYVALSGQASETAFEYKFEYDNYGAMFSPLSASLSPDSKSYTGTFSYGLSDTAYMNFSAEQEESARSSGNTQKRRSTRVSLSDQLTWEQEGDVSAALDGFWGDSKDSMGFSKSVEYGGSASAQVTLSDVASLNLSGDISISKDQIMDATYIWRTLNASYQRQINMGDDFLGGGWSGYISPGVTWQLSTGQGNELTVLTPQFSASMSREAESVSASYQVTMNETAAGSFQPDTSTTTASLSYARTLSENSQLSFDANWYKRDPKGMPATRAYQIGATYSLQIGKQARPALEFANLDGVIIEGIEALAETSLPFPTSFRLGVPMDAVLELLLERSVPTPTQEGRLYIYEAPYLPQLQTRQRLALQGDYGRLHRVAILFDLEGRGSKNPDQVFSEVRAYLFGKLGQPQTIQEDGKLTGPVNKVRDGIATGSVRRTYTWTVPRGRVVFGLPRNPERALRAEISFLPPDTLVSGPDWGLKVLP